MDHLVLKQIQTVKLLINNPMYMYEMDFLTKFTVKRFTSNELFFTINLIMAVL